MKMKLSEILITAGICSVLSTVFVSAVRQRTDPITYDLDRIRIVSSAMMQYVADNGDRYVPNHYFASANGVPTRFWPQILLPYHGSMINYRSTADKYATDKNLGNSFNPGGCTSASECEHSYAFRSSYGYNYQNFSPDSTNCVGGGLVTTTLHASRAWNPERTLMLISSVYDLNSQHQAVYGGGNYQVDPPSRFTVDGVSTLMPTAPGCSARWWMSGWNPNSAGWPRYGAAYPWHRQGTTFVIAYADGHVGSVTLPQLTAGTDVQAGWQGRIYDRDAYIWDLR